MSMNVTTQANLLTEKLHQMAIGQLYAELGFINQTNKWATTQKIENGSSFKIPTLGVLTSNLRAPGGAVVDQTPNPTQQTIPVIERETSFPMDPTWLASEGEARYAEQQIVSAINALSEDVMTDILKAIVQSAGIQAIGTLGVALIKADYDSMRKALTDAAITKNNRLAIISTDMMEDTSNITEYNDFDRSGVAGNHLIGITPVAAGFQILETPYAHSPGAGQHQGFACDPLAINTVFPMQETFNKGEVAVKTEADKDGLRLYLLREYVAGFNGRERWTMSVRFGAAVGRTAGVIRIDGR